jgi:hypothetical protein
VFSRSPAPEAAEAAIEPARQSEDGCSSESRTPRRVSVSDHPSGPLTWRSGPDAGGRSSWSGALEESSVAELHHAGFVRPVPFRMTLPCPQTALRGRPPRASTGAIPSRIAVASAMGMSTGTSLQPTDPRCARDHRANRLLRSTRPPRQPAQRTGRTRRRDPRHIVASIRTPSQGRRRSSDQAFQSLFRRRQRRPPSQRAPVSHRYADDCEVSAKARLRGWLPKGCAISLTPIPQMGRVEAPLPGRSSAPLGTLGRPKRELVSGLSWPC